MPLLPIGSALNCAAGDAHEAVVVVEVDVVADVDVVVVEVVVVVVGGTVTVMLVDADPPWFVTVSLIVYVPPVAYVYVVGTVPPTSELPSPKS